MELWCTRLALTLTDAAARIGALAGAIVHDWTDLRGQEWAERAALVHRELDRDAVAAAQVSAALAREQAPPSPDASAVISAAAAAALAATQRRTARLGGTEAHRADQERGMRIAQLPDS